MANQDEQSVYVDPEMDTLLADAPPDIQETVRGVIKRLQSILPSEEWLAIRRTLVSDLKASQEKKRLEQDFAELKKGMKEVEEGLEKLRKLKEKLDSISNG